MKKLLTLLFIFTALVTHAQINESFVDGDFIANPTWSGDDSVFVIAGNSGNNMLRSNKLITNSTYYMSTPSAISQSAQWELYVNLQFNTSSLNYTDIYLVADNANLLSPTLNGYFVRIGNTQDDICLYRKSAGTNTKIIDGIDGITNTSNNSLKIKVTRTAANDWTLLRDNSGTGNSYTTEGSVNDATYTSGGFFGIYIAQSTASFFQKHFFDDIYVGPILVDTTPPALISATAISAGAVDVLFDEPVELASAENATNYSINNGITVASALRDAVNLSLVHLTLGNSLNNNASYLLTVNNVSDISLNSVAAGSNASFSWVVPATAQYGDVVINEIYADPSPVVALPGTEFVELLNISSNAIDLTGWKIADPGTNGSIAAYFLPPGATVILCANADTALYSTFGSTIGVSSWPSLNNAGDLLYLRSSSGIVIDSVNYSDTWYQDAIKIDGGWTLEKIKPNLDNACTSGSNWIASNHPSGGTPGQINSVFNNTLDNTPPQIIAATANSASIVQLCFNEPVSPGLAVSSNFLLNNGIGNPATTVVNGNCMLLTLSQAMIPGTTYQITCSTLQDCSGNIVQNYTYSFTYFLPSAFDVVINEIMADPTPVNGLPDAEYIELYNKTSYNISTTGWTLTHGTTVRNFPDATIPADSFLVLTTSASIANLAFYGNVVAIPSLSSTALSNAGTSLIIADNNGQIIHSISYSDQWYNDATKAAGGWSLEMIDPSNPCAAAVNWTASTHPDGGTPGRKNAVFASNPDLTAPALASVLIINSNQIEVQLSETATNASALSASDFVISNGIGAASSITLSGSPVIAIQLSFNTPLQLNQIYTLTLSVPLYDCAGNSSNNGMSVQFANYQAKSFDVVINEIMADPDPAVGLPNAEYIELYNRSSFPINLANWQLHYSSYVRYLPNAVINAGEYVILCAPAAVPQLQGYGKTIAIPGMSSSALTNAGTMLYIADTLGHVIHAVAYSDSWYSDASKSDGGYSLEQVDVLNPCAGKNNWRATVNTSGGTPGSTNSVVSVNPDQKPSRIKGVCIDSFNTLTISFNEPQDSTSLTNLSNYNVDQGMGNPNAIYLQGPLYTDVELNFASAFNANTNYTLTFLGQAKDCAGNTMPSPILERFSLLKAKPYDIVINELMVDESPTVGLPESEFIELFNHTTNNYSLKNYALKTGSSESVFGCTTLKAGEYLVLLPKYTDLDETVYGYCENAMNYSSLTNTGAEVTLRSVDASVISTINYSDGWYGNSYKKDGGWSLEQIDPSNPCGGAQNWLPSTNVKGGSPGKTNAVNASNPDIKKPEIARIAFINTMYIVVYFSEPLDIASLTNTSSYQIDHGLGTPSLVTPYLPDYQKIGLQLATPMELGVVYNLSITGNITDCVGNPINQLLSGKFSIPMHALPGDIIINEILFNPKTDGFDFVEIYNKSNKVIDLNEIKTCNIDTVTHEISTRSGINTDGYLVFPQEYYVLTENPEVVQQQYATQNNYNFIDVETLPSMNVSDGSIGLVLNNDTLMDGIMYNDGMHYPLITDPKGVSLERISFSRLSNDAGNWNSAAQQVGFATPGYKNSQHVDDSEATDVISFSNELFSPDNDGYQDVLIVNYKMSEPGMTATARVYDVAGRYITEIFKNNLLGVEGSFSWNGINSAGEKSNIGIYMLYFQYFDLKGNTYKTRKTFVLAGKL